MTHVDQINTTALEFSRSATSFMQKMLEPIRCLNICGFHFVKVYRDGKRMHISSMENWTEIYLTKRIQDSVGSMEFYLPPTYIQQFSWEGLKNSKLLEALREFGVGNELSIVEHHRDFVDSFIFTKPVYNPRIDMFHKLSFMKDFIKDFKIKAADIIDSSDKRKLISPSPGISFKKIECPSYVQTEKICDFLNYLEQAEYPRCLKSTCSDRKGNSYIM